MLTLGGNLLPGFVRRRPPTVIYIQHRSVMAGVLRDELLYRFGPTAEGFTARRDRRRAFSLLRRTWKVGAADQHGVRPRRCRLPPGRAGDDVGGVLGAQVRGSGESLIAGDQVGVAASRKIRCHRWHRSLRRTRRVRRTGAATGASHRPRRRAAVSSRRNRSKIRRRASSPWSEHSRQPSSKPPRQPGSRLSAPPGRIPTAQLWTSQHVCFDWMAPVHFVDTSRRSTARRSTRQLLPEVEVLRDRVVVDVTHTSTHDFHTGIQRVTRECVSRWLTRRGRRADPLEPP